MSRSSSTLGNKMKTIIPRILVAAITLLLLPSCNSRQKDKLGIAALGIHTIEIYASGIYDISIVREVDGVRTEWLSGSMEAGGLSVHIQLGLPGKTMRVAMSSESSAAASSYEADVINDHPFVFNVMPIRKPGEYILMQTKDDKLPNQNKILLIAK